MPPQPLFNEHTPISSCASSAQQIHTHSSKFPIEREVTLSNCDKNSKVPILNDYHRKQKSSATAANEVPNIQTTWTTEDRSNRTYNEIRNNHHQQLQQQQHQQQHQFATTPDNHAENQFSYKNQMPVLDTTNGNEPSPILNQDDSNGFTSHSGQTGRSHSTPETECSSSANNKHFPSRTYQTIRDMISSRFNKSKSAAVDEANLPSASSATLNNDDNNDNTLTSKADESLSPHSQLAQRGVYLASCQQQKQQRPQPEQHNNVAPAPAVRTPNYNNVYQPQQLRSQELKSNYAGGVGLPYRERAIDVGHTVGVSQRLPTAAGPAPSSSSAAQYNRSEDFLTRQDNNNNNYKSTPAFQIAGGSNGNNAPPRNLYQEKLSKVPAGSRKPVFDSDPSQRPYHPVERNSGRNQKMSYTPEVLNTPVAPIKNAGRAHSNIAPRVQSCSRLNELHQQQQQQPVLTAGGYGRMSSSTNLDREMREKLSVRCGSSSQLQASTGRTNMVDDHLQLSQHTYRESDSQQISSDTKYNNGTLERCNIPRAKSNEHLLSENSGNVLSRNTASSDTLKEDTQLLTKSKSFENLPFEAVGKEIEKRNHQQSAAVSSSGGHSDSGRGSTIYSSTGKANRGVGSGVTDTSPDSSEAHAGNITAADAGKDSPWVDIVETELKHILDAKTNINSIANSTLSEDDSTTPPLPAGSPDEVSSDEIATRAYKHKSALYSTRPEQFPTYRNTTSTSQNRVPSSALWSSSRVSSKEKAHHSHKLAISTKTPESRTCRLPSTVASSSVDLESMMDEDNNSSEENVSTADTRAIRKQLEGLENMYSEILKLLGVRKSGNGASFAKQISSEPRIHKRRLHGSVSSLPSSVSSRPLRDRYRKYHHDDRKRSQKDLKGINKRFQTLESHVITLARSVAHLSSEMRTQHLMFQEINNIQTELASLRAQTNIISKRSNSLSRHMHLPNTEQVNSSPDKVKKLTKFFGDEPPLLRLFLKKLGYEKYATIFEKERIGLVELPYMSEERLQKLGIPMGPRLRILQEAQLGFPGTNENTLCIV